MFICPNCKTQHETLCNFCNVCGAKMEIQPPVTPVTEPPVQPMPPVQPPVETPELIVTEPIDPSVISAEPAYEPVVDVPEPPVQSVQPPVYQPPAQPAQPPVYQPPVMPAYGQPAQPPVYRPQTYAPPVYPMASKPAQTPSKAKSIVGMVLGIATLSEVGFFLLLFSGESMDPISTIVGIVFGFIGIGCAIAGLVLSSKARRESPNGMNLTGKITSIIALVLAALLFIGSIATVEDSSYDYGDYEYYTDSGDYL